MGNIGLRELLIEPVQRIPRYTLLIDALLRCMSPADPRRERLEEAVVLASRIASCESDDKDKRAAVMWGCKRAVDGFPVSNSVLCHLARKLTLHSTAWPHLFATAAHRLRRRRGLSAEPFRCSSKS